MVLQRRVIELPVVGSVDERSDPKQVRAPKLDVLDNVDLSETGAVKKRRTYVEAHTSQAGLLRDGAEGEWPFGVTCTHRKRTLKAAAHFDHRDAYVTGPSSDGSMYVGYVRRNGENNQDEWRVAVIDPETMEQTTGFAEETPLTVPVSRPVHLVWRDAGVMAIWVDTSTDNIRRAVWNHATRAWGTPGNLATDLTSSGSAQDLSVCQSPDGTTAWVMYVDDSGDHVVLEVNLFTLGGFAIDTFAPPGGAERWAIGYIASVGEPRCVLHNGTLGLWARDPVSSTSQVLDGGAAGLTVYNVTIGDGPDDGDNDILIGMSALITGHAFVSLYTARASDMTAGPKKEMMAHYIDSRPLKADGRVYMVLRHSPEPWSSLGEEASRFLAEVRMEPEDLWVEPVAALSYAIALKHVDLEWVCPLVEGPSGRLFWAGRNYVSYIVFGDSGSIGSATQTDISLYRFDFGPHVAGHNVRANGYHLVSGGIPLFHDGHGVDSAGLLVAPCIYDITISDDNGDLTSSETYTWYAVYEMMDELGRRWLSAPSAPVAETLGASHDTAAVEVYVPPSRVNEGRYLTRVALYRNTVAEPTVFRRSTQHIYPANPEYGAADWNVNGLPVVELEDIYGDDDIDGNEALYTTAGQLSDYPPPPCEVIAVHRRRVFAVHSETGDIWASKLMLSSEPVRWSIGLRIRNPFPGELPTALVSSESALVVFYRSRIGRIFGDGPDDSGANGQWSEIEFLPSSTLGAISQQCTEPTPVGVYFVDERQGACLLPWGGQPQIIGQDWPIQEEWSTDDVRGVDWLEDRDEVRFTGSSGTYRAYHPSLGVWTTGILTEGSGVEQTATWGRDHVYLDRQGSIWREDPSAETYPVGSRVHLTTGWLHLAELGRLQGRWRLWDIYLIGEYVDTHDLTVRIAYDYDDTTVHAVTFEDIFLAALPLYQLRVRPRRQQCQAIKITIIEDNSTSAGCKLSKLRLDFGVPARGGKPWMRQGAQGGVQEV